MHIIPEIQRDTIDVKGESVDLWENPPVLVQIQGAALICSVGTITGVYFRLHWEENSLL